MENNQQNVTSDSEGTQIQNHATSDTAQQSSTPTQWQQPEAAEQIGTESYLDEFSLWFSTNTDGTCSRRQ